MSYAGKIKLDDLHESVHSTLRDDNLAVSNNGDFTGFGWNPQGVVQRIDDNDKSIKYSEGWKRITGANVPREGVDQNQSYMQATELKEWVEITFAGTDLYMGAYYANNAGIVNVWIDGEFKYALDFYGNKGNELWSSPVAIATGLDFGVHKVRLITEGKSIESSGYYLTVPYFDVVTKPKSKNLFPTFNSALYKIGNIKIINPYHVVIDSTGVASGVENLVQYPNIPLKPNTQYTLVNTSINGSMRCRVDYTDGSSNRMVFAPNSKRVFTTAGNVKAIAIVYTNLESCTNENDPATYVFAGGGIREWKNPMLYEGSEEIPFETNGYEKMFLTVDHTQEKSSAFVGGNRIDTNKNIDLQVSDIMNMIPNSMFERKSATWSQAFVDDFHRANGDVGLGWMSGGSIVNNQLSLAPNTGTSVGHSDWGDREIKVSFVAPTDMIYIYTKRGQDLIRTAISTSGRVIAYEVMTKGDWKFGISETPITITAGTTYYAKAKAVGNMCSFSITSNPDYTTGATTIYYYHSNPNVTGFVGIEASSSPLLVNKVEVLTPSFWNVLGAQNGAIVHNVNKSIFIKTYGGNLFRLNFIQQFNDVVAGQPYTFRMLKKVISEYTGGSAFIVIDWQDKSGKFLSSVTLDAVKQTDNEFNELIVSAVAPINASSAYIYFRTTGAGESYWKEPMLVHGVYKTNELQFHTKESRVDLVSLQEDGQIVVTQGSGESELGYRIEAESDKGVISKWYRDKDTIPHWDRAKVWGGGSGWKSDNSGDTSSKGRIHSFQEGDTYNVSFVGTGITVLGDIGAGGGLAYVTIDNGVEQAINFYSDKEIEHQKKVFEIKGLSYGQHILTIRVAGARTNITNPIGMIGGTYVMLDAFDIHVPKIPDCPNLKTMTPISAVLKADPDDGWIRYDDTEGAFYNGAWTSNAHIYIYNGAEKENWNASDFAEFSFIGNGIRVIGYRGDNLGTAKVYIDGSLAPEMIQAGATAYNVVHFASGTTEGFHTIKIEKKDTKPVVIDAFDVRNGMHVIDLRKNRYEHYTDTKVLEHELKALHEAHPMAIQGDAVKLRIEKGETTYFPTLEVQQYTTVKVTFAKTFTKPPTVMTNANFQSRLSAVAGEVTTTGFTLFVRNVSDGQSAQHSSSYGKWIAIGY